MGYARRLKNSSVGFQKFKHSSNGFDLFRCAEPLAGFFVPLLTDINEFNQKSTDMLHLEALVLKFPDLAIFQFGGFRRCSARLHALLIYTQFGFIPPGSKVPASNNSLGFTVGCTLDVNLPPRKVVAVSLQSIVFPQYLTLLSGCKSGT
jgi:hypothetical protein